MTIRGMQIIKHSLMEDMTFLAYTKRKEELKQIKYRGSNLYDYVKAIFNSRLYRCNELKGLYISNVFNATQNKTFTEFMEELKTYTELAKVYDELIAAVTKECNDINIEEVRQCCLMAFTLDNYIGFLMEYIIKEALEQSGFIVECNQLLDDIYKADILVGHKDSLEVVAIQCKSNTFNKLDDTTKDKYINGLNRFKAQYKTYEGLKHLNNIHTKFVFYNEHYHYCSFNDNALVDAEVVKGIKAFDVDVNHFGYKGLKYNDTVDIIAEISNILGVEAQPMQRQCKYII